MEKEDPTAISPVIAEKMGELDLAEVAPHSFGVICLSTDEETGEKNLTNAIMIKKNQPLPCKVSEEFYTTHKNQTSINIQVTQGEVDDPEYCKVMHEELIELPSGRPPQQTLTATYDYDASGTINVTVCDVTSGKKFKLKPVDVGFTTNLEGDKLEEAKSNVEAFTVE